MFTDSLIATLTITIDATDYEISAGGIRSIRLDMDNLGFTGSAGFTVVNRDDTSDLFTAFVENTIATFSLSIQATWNQPDDTPDPLYVEGIITRKSVQEVTAETMKDTPVIWYDYEIEFMDAVQALWKQHFPTKIYVDSTMSTVITEQTPSDFTLSTDWDDLETTYDQICLPLGTKGNRASFYDFLVWYVKTKGGVIYYDYTNIQWVISGSKQEASDTATLDIDDVGSYKLVIPETMRHNIRLYNVSSESSETTNLTNDEAVTGIYHDPVIRSDIAADTTTEKGYLESGLDIPSNEVHLVFKQMPRTTFTVGSQVEFDDDKWYQNLSFNDDTFRVYEISLSARNVNQVREDNIDSEYTPFQIEMTSKMELKDNAARIFPAVIPPRYPLKVEGTVVSETGEDTDKTYQIYTDDDTSLEYYEVYIPLWDLNVRTRWIPNYLPGQLYFPSFRDNRVLVEADLHISRISHYLDWGDSTKLPSDYQGNHILFGKNDSDQTSVQHYYDESKPVLYIKRTYDTDTQLIQMSDESILFQVEEEDEDEE